MAGVGKLQRVRNGANPTVFVVAVAVVVVVALGVVAVLAIAAFDPFASETVDRSGPALLVQVRKLEQFTAAEGSFTQDVDIEQDAKYLPDFLAGERVTALVTGTVRATVDFSGLDDDAVAVSEDGRTITLTLPEPVLSDADIEESSARIINRDRGLVDRFDDLISGNPTDDTPLFTEAERKVEKAASESDLVEEARRNTETWLTTFLEAAGFDEVVINWQDTPA